MFVIVQPDRTHAHISHAKLLAQFGEVIVLGNRRKKHHAKQALLFKESAHVLEHVG